MFYKRNIVANPLFFVFGWEWKTCWAASLIDLLFLGFSSFKCCSCLCLEKFCFILLYWFLESIYGLVDYLLYERMSIMKALLLSFVAFEILVYFGCGSVIFLQVVSLTLCELYWDFLFFVNAVQSFLSRFIHNYCSFLLPILLDSLG